MTYLTLALKTFGILYVKCVSLWFLEPYCHCAISGALILKWKVTRAHISHSVSSAISDNHSFLTPPPVSCNAFFLFSFFICTSPISWCLQLPLHIFSLSSDFFLSFLFPFEWISLSCLLWKSDSLMNEMPFHQDATTAVTQNSICCLLCEIPLWIGALSFSLEHLMKDS